MPDRIIKESICTSDTLNQLSDFEERFWHRLTVNCDDYGRFDARPAILKGRLFPLMDGKTQKDMANALNKLASVGLVILYDVDGRPFLQVVTWERYQRIRSKRSKFPSPDDIRCHLTADAVKCPRNPIQSESESKSESNPKEARAPDPADRFAGELLATVNDWLAYKRERKESYKPTGLKSLLTEIENRVKAHGERAVIDVIRLSMSNGWRGIIWERIPKDGKKPSSADYDAPLSDWEKQWAEDVKRIQKDKVVQNG